MTRLLVSVRDRAEAQMALEAGVDLIDIKEPSRGSLGAASPGLWHDVMRLCGDETPVSAALGELLDDESQTLASKAAGLRYAKVGLAGCAALGDWPQRWKAWIDALPCGVGAVAVAYADAERAVAPDAEAVLEKAIELGCRALLFDTHKKDEGDLFDHMSGTRLRSLASKAHARQLLVVLGGSLGAPAIPAARQLRADYLAVRGAVCHIARDRCVDRLLIEQLLSALRSSEKHDAIRAASSLTS